MTSLEAFNLFVRCLETEGAQPVLEEARSLQTLVRSWFDQAEDAGRSARSPARNNPWSDGSGTNSGASQGTAIQLNRRECQILALLNEGLSNAQIAGRCFLTEGTVKWYLHALFQKFGVGNRTALLHVVRANGIEVPSSVPSS